MRHVNVRISVNSLLKNCFNFQPFFILYYFLLLFRLLKQELLGTYLTRPGNSESGKVSVELSVLVLLISESIKDLWRGLAGGAKMMNRDLVLRA